MKTFLMEQWLQQFLSDRSLSAQDGRPLFKYRVNEEEFLSLKDLLYTQWIPGQSNTLSAALFILFASECWRRIFNGGPWNWDLIFSSLGKKDPKPPKRDEIVQTGFRFWGRTIHQFADNGRNDYLGTVVAESGIPNFALSSDHYLGTLILRAFEKLSKISFAEDQAQIIEDLIPDSFPQVMKQESFYGLIENISEELIDLKSYYRLGNEEDPVACLNGKYNDWRNRFPIQIDNDSGIDFLNRVLSDIAKTKSGNNLSQEIRIEHSLTLESNTIESQLILPSKTYKIEELGMTESTFSKFSNKVQVVLSSGLEERVQIGYGFKSKDEGFRITGSEKVKLKKDAHTKSWDLSLEDIISGEFFNLTLPGKEALDPKLPWIFKETDNGLQFISTGSARVSGNSVSVVCPEDFSIVCESYTEDNFSESQKKLMIRKDCELHKGENLFRIRLSKIGGDNCYYRMAGESLSFYYKENEYCFKSFPKIYRINKDTGEYALSKKIQIKRPNENIWTENLENSTGRLRIRVTGAEDEVLFIKSIYVLPEDFSIEFNQNKVSGKIFLEGTEDFNIIIRAGDNTGEILRTQKGHEITFPSSKDIALPESIIIVLASEEFGNLELKTPFPNVSAKVYDANGNIIKINQYLYVNSLFGYRMYYHNYEFVADKVLSRMKLHSKDVFENIVVSRKVRKSRPIALIDFKDEIHQLFAYSEKLDAEIQFSINGQNVFRIKHYQFTGTFDEETNEFKIDRANHVNGTSVKALRFDMQLTIECFVSFQWNPVGNCWKAPEILIPEGTWLIYPGSKSRTNFRPLIYSKKSGPQENELTEIKSIADAGAIGNTSKRINLLEDFLSGIAPEFDHPAWKELEILWAETSHLPLVTFDVWTALSKSNTALISLYINSFSDELIERINNEYLIDWHSIPVKLWMELLTKYKIHQFSDINNRELAKRSLLHLFQKIEMQLGLSFVSEACSNKIFNLEATNIPPADILRDFIKTDIQGEMNNPGLITRNDQEWPDFLRDNILAGFQELPDDIQALFPADLVGYTKPVIYLPAIFAYKSVDSEWSWMEEMDLTTKYRINQMIGFDREWFDDTYNLIQGYLWSQTT